MGHVRFQNAVAMLRDSEARHRALYQSSSDAVMTLAPPSWKFTCGNPATVRMFGAKDEAEFISLGPWQVSPEVQPDGRPSAEKAKEKSADKPAAKPESAPKKSRSGASAESSGRSAKSGA